MKKWHYYAATAIILLQAVYVFYFGESLRRCRLRLNSQVSTEQAVVDTQNTLTINRNAVLVDSEDGNVPVVYEDGVRIKDEALNQILANVHLFKGKSKTEVIQSIAEAYPEQERQEGIRRITRVYDEIDNDLNTPAEREHLILMLLEVTQLDLEVIQQTKEADAFSDLPDKIRRSEKWLREAEAAGDTEAAERERLVIDRLKKIQERQENAPEREAERERRRQEYENDKAKYSAFKPSAEIVALIKERGLPRSHSEYVNLLKEEGLLPRQYADINRSIDVSSPSISSESSTEAGVASPSTFYDPVWSLSSIQTSLNSWRVDFDTNYFDVAISQYLTPREIETYFPTKQERQELKSRTVEAQKLVGSHIRKLVKDIPNATEKQKRDLTRQLVRDNFHKDFADSVLKALEQDANE